MEISEAFTAKQKDFTQASMARDSCIFYLKDLTSVPTAAI